MVVPLYTGNCLCQGVRFRIRGELPPIQVCHCVQCRKAQGTAMATNVPVDAEAFSLEAGADLLASYESSPGKHRVFCKVCGSPVFSRRDSLPGVLRVRLGLINEAVRSPLQAHFYAGSKANWWPIGEGVAQFEAGPESPRIATPGKARP